MTWPNTSLEPTAFTLFGSRCGRGFTDGCRGRGSVLGRRRPFVVRSLDTSALAQKTAHCIFLP
jgi:hypothetical protein